jgi:hypothetical protein
VTPQEFNRFVRRFVGPMKRDHRLVGTGDRGNVALGVGEGLEALVRPCRQAPGR